MSFAERRHPGAAVFCVLLHVALLAAFLQQQPRGHAAPQETTAIMLVLPPLARPAPQLPLKAEAPRAEPPLAPTPAPRPALLPPPLPAIAAAPATQAAPAPAAAAEAPAATTAGMAAAAAVAAPPPASSAAPQPTAQAAAAPAAVQMARPDHAHSPQPEYPMALRELGLQGTVLLRVWVEPDGRPGDIRLARSSGQRLFDDAALRAVRHWRFLPARAGEQAIASWVEFPIRFNLI